MKRCFLYPGQGAQYPGMARDLWEQSDAVKRLFDTASTAAGFDCRRALFESSEEQLKSTDVAQVAIVLASKAASAVLGERGVVADGCAGFSLGEYTALSDAGVIADVDLFAIVSARGAIMERCSRSQDTPAGPSGMAAVVGLELPEVQRILASLGNEDPSLRLYPGLHNAPTQIVVSGTAEALEAGRQAFEDAGAANYVVLKTSGPFHCPLMQSARDDLAAELEGYRFSDPRKPVYSNVTGAAIASGEEAKRLCAEQLVSTVRWVDVESKVLGDGYEQLLEVGPGKVLSGLLKRYSREQKVEQAGTLEQISSLQGARS